MKLLKYKIVIAFVASLFASCNDQMSVDRPKLEVYTDVMTVKVGEPVIFSLEGDANYINFYSGEVYSDYKFREGRTVELGWENLLSFMSKVEGGTQVDQLKIYASNKFDGNYQDFDNILNTAWIDITPWFTLATNANATASSAQSVSSFVEGDFPFYLAFRYTTKVQADNGTPRRWSITDLKIQNVTETGNVTAIDLVNAGFRLIDPFMNTKAPSRTSISQTQIALQGNLYGPDENGVIQGEDIETEHWVISKPLHLTGTHNLGPDRSIAIKNLGQVTLKEHIHTYKKAGTYYATFVGANQTMEKRKEVVRTIKIVIEDEE